MDDEPGITELPSWSQLSSSPAVSGRRVASNSSISNPSQGSGEGPFRLASCEKECDLFANAFSTETIDLLWGMNGSDENLKLDWVRGRKRPTRLIWRSRYDLIFFAKY
jgi:hypothetical protein